MNVTYCVFGFLSVVVWGIISLVAARVMRRSIDEMRRELIICRTSYRYGK